MEPPPVNGRDILRHRLRLGETQAQFARRFGVNQTTISRWERGELAITGIAEVVVDYVLAELALQPDRGKQAAE